MSMIHERVLRHVLRTTTLLPIISKRSSTILFMHVCASRLWEKRWAKKYPPTEGERCSVPRREAHRFKLFVTLATLISILLVAVHMVLVHHGVGIWKSASYVR